MADGTLLKKELSFTAWNIDDLQKLLNQVGYDTSHLVGFDATDDDGKVVCRIVPTDPCDLRENVNLAVHYRKEDEAKIKSVLDALCA